MTTTHNRTKIEFRLTRDADGYPPFDWEGIWAEPCGDDRWRLDNVPFFVYDVNNRDVVTVERVDAKLVFADVVERGGHQTLRIIFEDLSTVDAVRTKLAQLGCSTEASNSRRLVAVDVKPDVVMSDVRAYLDEEAIRSGLEYEDGHGGGGASSPPDSACRQ